MFMSEYQMRIEGRRGLVSLPTTFGAILSILMNILMLVYLTFGIMTVLERNGQEILTTMKEAYVEDTEVFDS